MPVPCPFCHTPSDMPMELFEKRKAMSMSERIMFDLLWRRSPGFVTRQEFHDAFAHFGETLSDNSLPTNIHRINKKLDKLATATSAYAKGWRLVSPHWDRRAML